MQRPAAAPEPSKTVTTDIRERIIVALDVPAAETARGIIEELGDSVSAFKIGMQLFTAAGPDIVRKIVARGSRVFLDLKFHDIPNTVAMAAVEATRLGVSLFNIHASGGPEMMKSAVAAVNGVAARENLVRPKILGVTLLTSVDEETLQGIGWHEPPQAVVSRLASLANDCGLDGVVASAQELKTIRAAVPRSGFLIVTPGMRSATSAADDQRRTMTVSDAIRAGSDYLVVGRPILNAPDPSGAAQRFVAEIEKSINDA